MTLKQFLEDAKFTADERFALSVIEKLSDKVKMLEAVVSSLRLQLEVKDEVIKRDNELMKKYIETIGELTSRHV